MLLWFGKRLNELQHVPREERGFTLIELLIVIIIIGILAAIAIPVFLSQRLKAQQAASKSDTRNAGTAQVLYYADNDTFSDELGVIGPPATFLLAQGFRQSNGVQTRVDADSTDTDNYCVESVYGTFAAPVAGTQFHMADNSGGVVPDLCP